MTAHAAAPPTVDWLNVKNYGALGDNATDDTAAFVACRAAADALLATTDRRPKVFVPSGKYRVHELEWDEGVEMVGNGPYHTQLTYNGTGGTASYVMKIAGLSSGGTDAYGGSGLSSMRIGGHSLANTTDKIAQNCVTYVGQGSTGADWGLQVRQMHFGWCFGDAVTFNSNQIVNLHLERVRFDTCGGFALSFYGVAGSGNPVTVDKFTYASVFDAGPAATMGVRATADGYYDGTNWGNGFVNIDVGTDYYFHFQDGRLELTALNVYDSRRQAFYVRSGSPKIRCSGVVGKFNQAKPGIFFRDKGGAADFELDGKSFLDFAKLLETTRSTSPEWDLGAAPAYKRAGMVRHWGGAGSSNGVYLNGSQIEFRDSIPTAVSRDYKRGDIVYNRAAATGQPQGWVVTAPTSGWGNPTIPTLTTTAHVTSASTSVAITTANDFYKLPIGIAVTLVGAGAAGADLNTIVNGIDYAANTITVADTPSTTVNPATIKQQTVTFSPMANL